MDQSRPAAKRPHALCDKLSQLQHNAEEIHQRSEHLCSCGSSIPEATRDRMAKEIHGLFGAQEMLAREITHLASSNGTGSKEIRPPAPEPRDAGWTGAGPDVAREEGL